VQRLWAFLLVHRDKTMTREHIAGVLWPDDERSAFHLRHSLHLLGKTIPSTDEALPWILKDGDKLRWNPEAPLKLDLDRVMALATGMTQGGSGTAGDTDSERLAELETAVARGSSLLFEGLDEDWLESPRRTYRGAVANLAEALIALREQAGDLMSACDAALALLAMDPLHEPAYRHLMRLHWKRGDRAGAMGYFEACRAMLDKEFSVAPSAETVALLEQLQLAAAIRVSEPQPSLTPLPRYTSPLFDKDRVEKVGHALEQARVVTLTGVYGCGKSRIAVEAAHRVAPRFDAGVAYVDGRDLMTDKLVQAVAEASSVPPSSGMDGLISALSDLAEGGRLLVLDNVDQLLDEVADLVENLTKAAPQVQVLVTALSPLGIVGEVSLRIALLKLPPLGARGTELADFEATGLFLSRAGESTSAPSPTSVSAQAVATVTRELEGHPLALEAAASVLRETSLEELQARLPGVDVTSAPLGVSERTHASLDAAFARAVSVLTSDEVEVLAKISMLHRPFSVEDAELACSDKPANEVGRLLEMLSLRSFIETDPNAAWEDRHRVLKVVRASALGQPRLQGSV
jgi:DNA-binding SARP family transcriptional activator